MTQTAEPPLKLAGLQHLSDDDVFDLLGLNARALERRLDRKGAELGRLEAREAAAQLAHQARANEQLVRGDFGVGRTFLQRRDEELRPEFHEVGQRNSAGEAGQLIFTGGKEGLQRANHRLAVACNPSLPPVNSIALLPQCPRPKTGSPGP